MADTKQNPVSDITTETKSGIASLLQSRKAVISLLVLIATVATVVLRALDKIQTEAMAGMIGSIVMTGVTLIGSIAYEDGQGKKAAAPVPSVTQLNVNPASEARDGE